MDSFTAQDKQGTAEEISQSIRIVDDYPGNSTQYSESVVGKPLELVRLCEFSYYFTLWTRPKTSVV